MNKITYSKKLVIFHMVILTVACGEIKKEISDAKSKVSGESDAIPGTASHLSYANFKAFFTEIVDKMDKENAGREELLSLIVLQSKAVSPNLTNAPELQHSSKGFCIYLSPAKALDLSTNSDIIVNTETSIHSSDLMLAEDCYDFLYQHIAAPLAEDKTFSFNDGIVSFFATEYQRIP